MQIYVAYRRLLSFTLITATLVAQSTKLSDAAQDLITKPRLGHAQLTMSDGNAKTGRIVRVTDQFVAFEPDSRKEAWSATGLPVAGHDRK